MKKISATAILVIALLALTMAGALAAALNAWGVIDFAGNLSWTYVPENARDSVTAENMTVETDQLICTIRAYNCWEKTRYEAVTFRVEKVK